VSARLPSLGFWPDIANKRRIAVSARHVSRETARGWPNSIKTSDLRLLDFQSVWPGSARRRSFPFTGWFNHPAKYLHEMIDQVWDLQNGGRYGLKIAFLSISQFFKADHFNLIQLGKLAKFGNSCW
jgi:hypothetical protein